MELDPDTEDAIRHLEERASREQLVLSAVKTLKAQLSDARSEVGRLKAVNEDITAKLSEAEEAAREGRSTHQRALLDMDKVLTADSEQATRLKEEVKVVRREIQRLEDAHAQLKAEKDEFASATMEENRGLRLDIQMLRMGLAMSDRQLADLQHRKDHIVMQMELQLEDEREERQLVNEEWECARIRLQAGEDEDELCRLGWEGRRECEKFKLPLGIGRATVECVHGKQQNGCQWCHANLMRKLIRTIESFVHSARILRTEGESERNRHDKMEESHADITAELQDSLKQISWLKYTLATSEEDVSALISSNKELTAELETRTSELREMQIAFDTSRRSIEKKFRVLSKEANRRRQCSDEEE